MSYVVHPSPRQHNEFSYENGQITYWWDGSVRAVYDIDDAEIEYYEELTDKQKDNIYYLSMYFLKEIEGNL